MSRKNKYQNYQNPFQITYLGTYYLYIVIWRKKNVILPEIWWGWIGESVRSILSAIDGTFSGFFSVNTDLIVIIIID